MPAEVESQQSGFDLQARHFLGEGQIWRKAEFSILLF